MKNGAELLDRLIKDIVSESAAFYVSILTANTKTDSELKSKTDNNDHDRAVTTFSLPRFIPLLQERIHVINPFTRIFLVNWIALLNSVPDLELVSYLPSFLKGLFRFLSDPNQEVHSATQRLLGRILNDIQKVARIKKSVASNQGNKLSKDAKSSAFSPRSTNSSIDEREAIGKFTEGSPREVSNDDVHDSDSDRSVSQLLAEDLREEQGDDWQPDQDIQIEYLKILEILVSLLTDAHGEAVPTTSCFCC